MGLKHVKTGRLLQGGGHKMESSEWSPECDNTKKKVSCYCRVSTDKEAQLESLTKQMEYFEDFAKREGYDLVKVYVDEGIKGTQLKKREQFKQMIRDAEKNMFNVIYVKDVSRFARNTEDFLHNIRKIKSYGVEVFFMSHGLGIQEGSELYLTMLAMLAQEESASLSKKIKFGKNITAKKGRVPNFVFGYDKIDCYTLAINLSEKEIVEKIFDLYVTHNYGTARIAGWLNDHNVLTKKGHYKNWHQMVVAQILKNQIYIGKIINKKSEIVDFLTGKRKDIPKEQWEVVERKELQIISDSQFQKAQELLDRKRSALGLMNKRESTKYPLSNLIKCAECGYSFRRIVRQYRAEGRVYIRWVDSLRNAKGVHACNNNVIINEANLMGALKRYFEQVVKKRTKFILMISNKMKGMIKEQYKVVVGNQQENLRLFNQRLKEKEKYMQMFKEEIISIEELKGYTKDLNKQLDQLRTTISVVDNEITLNNNIEKKVSEYYQPTWISAPERVYENEFLRTIIHEILVNKDGDAQVVLNPMVSQGMPITTTVEYKEVIVEI